MEKPTGIGTAVPRCRLGTNDKIDVCRGLFAFLVVIAHSLEVTFSILPDQRAGLGPVAELFVRAAGSGFYWVMGFFVISGYCIHLSVQRLCDRGAFTLRTYLIARATRLLPLYYLALMFAVIVEWGIASCRPANWPNGLNYQTLSGQVVLIQNLTQTYGSFASSWSITNEAFYYAFYGLLVVAAMQRGLRPLSIGLASCIGVGGAMYLAYRFGLRSPAIATTALMFGMGTHWFLGALIAAHRDRLARDPSAQFVARAWPLILAASVAVKCLENKGSELIMMGSGLAFALLMIRFLGADRGRPASPASAGPGRRTQSIIAGLGLASYPTYLLHGPIIMLTGSVLIRLGLADDWRWTSMLLAASGIASGVLGGYLLEAPLMSWRAAFLRRISAGDARGRIDTAVQLPIPATR